MSRIVIIKTPDGNQGLYLLADHMMLDAQSLIMFMRDISELYANAKYEGVDYPKEMRSYIEQLEYFYYYMCKIMFKGIEKPYLPIGDILKLI